MQKLHSLDPFTGQGAATGTEQSPLLWKLRERDVEGSHREFCGGLLHSLGLSVAGL